jgi:uncharacterized protein (DUF736 family)
MANIGSFKKVGNDFNGEIITLSLQAKGVRIVAEQNRSSNENAPSHRVFVGRAEIGAAWSKRSEEGRDYLSLKLDDPSFNAPIYANLLDEEGDVRSSLARSGGKNWLRRFLDHPSQLTRAGLRKSGQARPRRAADAERPHASEDLAPGRRRGPDLG